MRDEIILLLSRLHLILDSTWTHESKCYSAAVSHG